MARRAKPPAPSPVWSVYLLRCADASLYCGISIDVESRLQQHNLGKASRYTRSRLPVVLVYREEVGTKGDALRRELAIKRLDASAKRALLRWPRGPQPLHL